MKQLEVGQKVAFNWSDGIMITEVSEIKNDNYFCYMPMLKKIEAFKRDELSDDITKRALKTAFRRTGQY